MTPEQWDRFNKINNKMIQSMSEMSTNMGSDLENLTKMNEDMDMDICNCIILRFSILGLRWRKPIKNCYR